MTIIVDTSTKTTASKRKQTALAKRRATVFAETLRTAENSGTLFEKLFTIFPGADTETDEETAQLIFHKVSDLIITAKKNTITFTPKSPIHPPVVQEKSIIQTRAQRKKQETPVKTPAVVAAPKKSKKTQGKALADLLQVVVDHAQTASDEISDLYGYGDEALVEKTHDSALIVGVLAIAAPWVLFVLGFPSDQEETLDGSFAERWMEERNAIDGPAILERFESIS